MIKRLVRLVTLVACVCLAACTTSPTALLTSTAEPDARLLTLAEAYRLEGRYDQARRILASLQAIHSESKAVQLQTASLLQAQGDVQAAEAIYRELAPDDLDASLAFASLLHASNRANECVALLSDAVNAVLYGGRADALVLRARCLIQSVQFEAAQADLTAALRIQPNHVEARFHQTRVFALTGQFERAEMGLSEVARDGSLGRTELGRLQAEIAEIRGRFEILGAGFGTSGI